MTLSEIHKLEIQEEYPAAIDALEERYKADPNEPETVIRLGFNLWYVVVENDRMGKNLPVKKYAARFSDLFKNTKEKFRENADYCWAYGLGISLFWYFFADTTEGEGKELLNHAKQKDIFWAGFMKEKNLIERFLRRIAFSIISGEKFGERRKFLPDLTIEVFLPATTKEKSRMPCRSKGFVKNRGHCPFKITRRRPPQPFGGAR